MHCNQSDRMRWRRLNDAGDGVWPSREQILNFLAHVHCGLCPKQRSRLCRSPVDQLRPDRHATDALARTPVILNTDIVYQRAPPVRHADPVHEALINRRVVSCDKPACHRIHAAISAYKQVRTDAHPVLELRHGLAAGI
ncbi:hypothetical protein D9M68_797370 [compost metagenome]